ncbi:hypothetical protein F0521_15100 [Ferrimonas sp. YFM]|nr:hypothetical protein F0521_15100 [Ferrimonas sp. YFM]
MMNLPTYENDHYILNNAEERHEESPESFWIPSREIRESLVPGTLVKLIFSMEVEVGSDEVSVERMWVEVTQTGSGHYVGRLENDPYGSSCVQCDQTVNFMACHVIDVYEEEV